ncbi:MAG TPA: DUF5330 domain-containing protein [Pseudolabrys sp.]|nr:DUF5330 domain-containing protein [Pseudolabrys sp.]
MFFIMRMMFWLAVICVLLPGSGSKTADEQGQAPTIDTLQAVSAATATYSDMRGFCERQASACAVGSQVAAALGHRAQDGAKTLVDFISQQMSDSGAGKTAAAEKKLRSQNTLTAADIAPAWNGPVAQSPIQVPLPPVPPRRDAQNRRPTA